MISTKTSIRYVPLFFAVLFAFLSGGLGSKFISYYFSVSTVSVVIINGVLSAAALVCGLCGLYYHIVATTEAFHTKEEYDPNIANESAS